MKKDKDEVSLEGLLEMWNEDYSDIGSVHKWDYSAGYEGD